MEKTCTVPLRSFYHTAYGYILHNHMEYGGHLYPAGRINKEEEIVF